MNDEEDYEALPPEDTVKRNLIVLLLDASGSMTEPGGTKGKRKIDELNDALKQFLAEDMHHEAKLEHNGEIAVGAFWGSTAESYIDWLDLGPSVEPDSPFRFVRHVKECSAIEIQERANTPMGEAICAALDVIEARKDSLARNALTHEHRPNVFLLTDGKPTSPLDLAIERLHAEEDEDRLLFWGLGIGETDEAVLKRICDKLNCYDMRAKPIKWYLQFIGKSMRHQDGALGVNEVYQHMSEDIASEMDELIGQPSGVNQRAEDLLDGG